MSPEFNIFGKKVSIGDDGQVEVTEGGKTVKMGPDGDVTVNIDRISRIDIENIDDLNYFKKETLEGVTTIDMNFANDGHFRIQYTRDGKVLDFHGSHVGSTISKDNVITLRANKG